MDYHKNIISLARRNETVRAFANRMLSNTITAQAVMERINPVDQSKAMPKVSIVFTFDKENDTMHATRDGKEIAVFHGDSAWGEAIKHFKTLFVRRELDPKNTQFLFTGRKGLIDISGDFGIPQ